MMDLSQYHALVMMLERANIPHKEIEEEDFYKVMLLNDNRFEIDNAVINPFSHGYESGLLETHVLNNFRGYETAQDIFDGWKEMYQESKGEKPMNKFYKDEFDKYNLLELREFAEELSYYLLQREGRYINEINDIFDAITNVDGGYSVRVIRYDEYTKEPQDCLIAEINVNDDINEVTFIIDDIN